MITVRYLSHSLDFLKIASEILLEVYILTYQQFIVPKCPVLFCAPSLTPDCVCVCVCDCCTLSLSLFFRHLDNHHLWDPNEFAVSCFRIIMYSIQARHTHTHTNSFSSLYLFLIYSILPLIFLPGDPRCSTSAVKDKRQSIYNS